MVEGHLPFRYLGVPIASKRLSALECDKLVDRVIERIKAVGTRKLSYAGRLVLIKSVLSTLHCYWAKIFILPASILNKVEALCRSFLWQGKESANSPPLISWSTCCKSKKEGGLGIIDLRRWNRAALGKYIWWISHKKDHLWVKWVHSIYIKNSDWMSYQPKPYSSWSWRKICGVKDILQAGFHGQWWLKEGNAYSIQQGYQWLGDADVPKVWAKFVWKNLSIPKHCFIGWLVANERLLIKDRLQQFHIISDPICHLCGLEDEDHMNLFFNCIYSSRCVQILSLRLDIIIPTGDFIQWWLKLRVRSLLKKKIIAALIKGLAYKIWEVRNHCRFESVIARPEFIVSQVRKEVLSRIDFMCKPTDRVRIRQWLS
ncbi:uncharacterized protein LOC141637248 [Silene latifolia]|uniref:uncharacterized protein LOC141637248 n=1 Tax=Silene latifolia TaxID=37657 RepID=UPI003D77E66E